MPVAVTVGAPLAVTVLATAAFAAARTRAGRSTSGGSIAARDLLAALPHAAFGLLAGALLTFGTITALVAPAGPGGIGPDRIAGGGAVTALPLTLSMGAAEWILYRFRRRAHRMLRESTTLARFARRVRALLAAAVTGYLAVLAALGAMVAWLGQSTGGFAVTPGQFWTSVALGGALFVALALRSCGVTGLVLVACATAFAAEAVLVWPGGPRPWDLDTVQFFACGVLFAVLLGVACAVLGRATRHR
jgi:hypothetical protein